jgi:hypothetical protein
LCMKGRSVGKAVGRMLRLVAGGGFKVELIQRVDKYSCLTDGCLTQLLVVDVNVVFWPNQASIARLVRDVATSGEGELTGQRTGSRTI